MKRAAIGVSSHLGWAATATLALDAGRPRVLRTDRLETAPGDDREALEPYHVAGGFHGLKRVPVPGDPAAVLRRGLRKQRRCTARAVAALARELERDGRALAWAGILTSRGRPAPDLSKALGSHTQIHVEEGLAVRTAFAEALAEAGARVRELDQKSLLEIAGRELGRGADALMAELAELRPQNGGAWRKEEKLAAVAAWLAARRSR